MFKNLKIGMRLALGFGVILVPTLATTLIGIYTMDKIDQRMDSIINNNLYKMSLLEEMSQAISSISEALPTLIILNTDERSFRETQTRILAERAKYDSAVIKFEQTPVTPPRGTEIRIKMRERRATIRPLTDRLMVLAADNNTYEQAKQLFLNEVAPAQADWRAVLQENVNYQQENNRRDVAEAKQAYETARLLMFSLSGASLTLGTIFAIILTLSITGRLSPMVTFANRISVGDFPNPLAVNSHDEIGQLSISLNSMLASFTSILQQIKEISQGNYEAELKPRSEKDELVFAFSNMTKSLKYSTEKNKQENWLKTGQAELNNRLRGEQNLANFAQDVIRFIVTYLDAKVGAIYLAEEQESFKLYGSYAYTKRKNISNEFKLGEGIVGQAALEKTNILISQVPEDYITISSGLGSGIPRYVMVVPFLYREKVEGVIELGSFHEFTDTHIEFLNQAAESIAIAFNSARSRAQIQELLQETQVQAEELQVQQEELQQTNEELEEKAELMSRQKQEVEFKNNQLEQARKAIEEKAEQLALSSKYKSEFLANMSHELRTPLNSLLILAKLLADNNEGNLNSKQVDYSRTIYAAGTDLLGLINDILDLAKIESGTMSIEIAPLSFNDLQDYIERTFRQVSQNKGLEFTVEFSPDLPEAIYTDSKRLQQVLKNLLSNAFKFTEQGAVRLNVYIAQQGWSSERETLNRADTAIAFAVSDTGIGIAPDKQKIIFEAFQQADGTTSRKYGGTGLGLSISREIARILGGEIRLESHPGEGSTFTFYLPQGNRGAEAQRRRGTGAHRSRGVEEQGSRETEAHRSRGETLLRIHSGLRTEDSGLTQHSALRTQDSLISDDRHQIQDGDRVLLIVEDDTNFARILLDMVREQGFKGIVAQDGDTGLAMAQQVRPNAILLDIRLPLMDGWMVLDRLKHDPNTRHIPVHMMSVEEGQQRSLQLGAMAFLQKPATSDDLNRALSEIKGFIERPVKNLLVVEDNEMQRLSIIDLIGNSDVKTTAVGTGAEALAALRSKRFDCVVLDLGLPDMNGFELIERINRESNGQIPIIVYTGQELTKQEETQLRRMAETVIIKDVRSPERLLDETALFLHRVQANLPAPKRKILERLQQTDPILTGKQVLIVDDDIRNIFALTGMLEQHQMQVHYAENGRDGITLLQNTPQIDVVLMDVMMPEMDGYETMRAIRQSDRFKSLPIIALTAKAMQGDREKCIDAGASDYITKPVDPDQLLSLLRVWLYQ